MKKIITALFLVCMLPVSELSAQCLISSVSATPSACNPATNQYNVSGTIVFSNAPASGNVIVTNDCGGGATIGPPFSSPLAYTITGLSSDSVICHITAYFSANAFCSNTASYFAPASCGFAGVDEYSNSISLSVIPNPSNGIFNLSFDLPQQQTISLSITDISGKKVYAEEHVKFAGSYSKQLDLTAFTRGIYFVKIIGKNTAAVQKIIYY